MINSETATVIRRIIKVFSSRSEKTPPPPIQPPTRQKNSSAQDFFVLNALIIAHIDYARLRRSQLFSLIKK